MFQLVYPGQFEAHCVLNCIAKGRSSHFFPQIYQNFVGPLRHFWFPGILASWVLEYQHSETWKVSENQ
jgi:hypothetical protein